MKRIGIMKYCSFEGRHTEHKLFFFHGERKYACAACQSGVLRPNANRKASWTQYKKRLR